jgi:hypothetical protein
MKLTVVGWALKRAIGVKADYARRDFARIILSSEIWLGLQRRPIFGILRD